MLDGASNLVIFLRVVIPISMPIIATICIFSAVGQWNSWYDAYMFVTKRADLHPVQTYLYRVIAMSSTASQNAAESKLAARMSNVTTIRAATVIVNTVPILFIYMLFQKHFIKGVMIGALKG